MTSYANDVLASRPWLQEHLQDPQVRIIEVNEDASLYADAHIPGAIGFDWKRDLQDPLRRDFLDHERFGALLGSVGISNDHTIVLYGDRNNWFAAYMYWYLKYYGHNDVKLLDGPREKWLAEGRPTTTELPALSATTFTASPGDDRIRARRDEVLAAIDLPTRIVDVRSPPEFRGEVLSAAGYEHEGAAVAGHIPGARSVPWSQAVNEDGTFKSREELHTLYGEQGLLNDESVIAYCRIGERSAHSWFVLHELLGVTDVKNYDGSWLEWGSLVGAAFLDFGFFKHLGDSDVGQLLASTRATYNADGAALLAVVAELGALPPDPALAGPFLESYQAIFGWLLADQPLTIDASQTADMMRRYNDLRTQEGFGGLALPAEHFVLIRAVMLLIGLLGQLRATGTWLDVAREWLLDEEPVTELGRLEAEFFDGRFTSRSAVSA